MLKTLRRIVQEVNSAKDLQSALRIIVRRVRKAMQTDVCSVYLLNEENQRYVLMATLGLNRNAVGRVSLSPSEGLVGLVGQREEPLNLEDAPAHPRYQYFAETGEERYHSFLGVPIIHQRKVLGVLVVQHRERRRFDEGEEAFLVTMSAQLAGVIAHAKATGVLQAVKHAQGKSVREARFEGVAGAPGVGIGTAMVMTPVASLEGIPDKPCQDIEAEIQLFQSALQAVRDDIAAVSNKLSPRLRAEEQALFEVYLRMLDDNVLGAEVVQKIREDNWAQGALAQVIGRHVKNLELVEDPYLRERAADVRDLGRRILSYLQERNNAEVDYPERTILVGDELTPAMLGEVPREKLAGLVSVQGSGNSHAAILARAMGVPTVMGMVDLPYTQLQGHEVVVDGFQGVVYTDPSPQLRQQYETIVEEERQLSEGLEALRDQPCETLDGYRMTLCVNAGLVSETGLSANQGVEGVGLYRTEEPFMLRERFPSEQEQYLLYREQLQAYAPQPVTMRTLDIGGDKSLPYFPIEEANPFLGWRGIRVTLDHPEVFLAQIRAMLRASEKLDNLRIMLPMISNVVEVDDALQLIYRAYHELRAEGVDIKLPPIGVMVEVPAAVYQARELAQRVDFLSVGSNDLTQYLLAVDRNNPRVAYLYHSLHPAVLRALKQVVDSGHAEGKPVSICGELAGDPAGALLLMAMGYDSLSMNLANLPRVKSVIRRVTREQATDLLNDILELDTLQVVQSTMSLALSELGLGRLVGPAWYHAT